MLAPRVVGFFCAFVLAISAVGRPANLTVIPVTNPVVPPGTLLAVPLAVLPVVGLSYDEAFSRPY